MESRNPYMEIWQELSAEKSMVFIAGPRQTGKTTFSQIISDSYTNHLYFNWDVVDDRTRLMEDPYFFQEIKRKDMSTPLIVFDEIHKYKEWKNYLKGVYDRFHSEYQLLVSGSGRLDIYQKGGDSLAGRYYLFHLWPFTLAELGKVNLSMETFLKNPLDITMDRNQELNTIWEQLSRLSGFPEPFLSDRRQTYRRWTNTYSQQLIREDIRDLTGIKSVGEMETLYHLLPSKLGSPLSVSSIVRDLKVAYNTVRNWLSAFERFFLTFSISPWTSKIARAVQKERKVYLWDTPRINEPAARFENMVALELWRAVTAWSDRGHGRFSLHFVKDRDQQEVDFLIDDDGKPLLLVEAKYTDAQPSPALVRFQRALHVPAVQLLEGGDTFKRLSMPGGDLLIAPASAWLARLP